MTLLEPIQLGGFADPATLGGAALLAVISFEPKATEVCGCPLTQLGPSGVVLSLDRWCADAFSAIGLRCDLLEQAKKRFAVEGIGLPLPQTLVLLKDHREAKALAS